MEIPDPEHDPIPSLPTGNWFTSDPYLPWLLHHLLDASTWSVADRALSELGELVPEFIEPRMIVADANPPVLRTHDARGHRIDEVVFNSAYLEIERKIIEFGTVRAAYLPGWHGLEKPAPRVLVAALQYLFLESDQSIMGCPIGMSDAMARCLQQNDPALAKRFVPRLADDSRGYLRGAMLLTERYGGSDVGANVVEAVRESDTTWRLSGEKWFASCPHSDLFLVTARPQGAPSGTKGLGLFLVPRMLDNGTRNPFTIRRLKDKFGTRAMPSGEIEFENTFAWQVGDVQRGMREMLDMINLTRICIAVVCAGAMRRNVFEALHHATNRIAFGAPLIDQPLMADTLVEMVVDSHAATCAAFALADALDKADAGIEPYADIVRLLTPLYKTYSTERARITATEGMEVRGGNGVINEWPEARILRDISVHAIWEGSSNVIALDVLRAIRHGAFPPLLDYLEDKFAACPDDAPIAPLCDALQLQLHLVHNRIRELLDANPQESELGARRLSRSLAVISIATTLAEQSVWEWHESNSGRLSWIAARYTARLVTSSSLSQLLDNPGWLKYRSELLSGGKVPVELAHDLADRVAHALHEEVSTTPRVLSSH
ncbi:MAG: acyl-CoA dehydrogenase family protein [Candidatus Dormibacteria bacterium]